MNFISKWESFYRVGCDETFAPPLKLYHLACSILDRWKFDWSATVAILARLTSRRPILLARSASILLYSRLIRQYSILLGSPRADLLYLSDQIPVLVLLVIADKINRRRKLALRTKPFVPDEIKQIFEFSIRASSKLFFSDVSSEQTLVESFLSSVKTDSPSRTPQQIQNSHYFTTSLLPLGP